MDTEKQEIVILIKELQDAFQKKDLNRWIQYFDPSNQELIQKQICYLKVIFASEFKPAAFHLRDLFCRGRTARVTVDINLIVATQKGEEQEWVAVDLGLQQNINGWCIKQWSTANWVPFNIHSWSEEIQIFQQDQQIQMTASVRVKRKRKDWGKSRLEHIFCFDSLAPSLRIGRVDCMGVPVDNVEPQMLLAEIAHHIGLQPVPDELVFTVILSGQPPQDGITCFESPHFAWHRLANATVFVRPYSLKDVPRLRQKVIVSTQSPFATFCLNEFTLVTQEIPIQVHRRDHEMELVWDVNPDTLWGTLFCFDKYQSVCRTINGVPILCHLLQEDVDHMEWLLDNVNQLLQLYSQWFCPYPFEHLTLFEIRGCTRKMVGHAGRGFVALSQNGVRSHSMNVLAHEIAHQWWWHHVHYAADAHMFLSEGMATYCDWLAHEYLQKQSPFRRRFEGSALSRLILRVLHDTEVPLSEASQEQLYTRTFKGAFVHHMLRRLLGDEVFFGVWQEHARRHGGPHKVSISDFQDLVENLYGQPLDWFFEQWVHDTGLPELSLAEVTVQRSPGEPEIWQVTGVVQQVGKKIFRIRVDLKLETESGTVWKSIFQEQRIAPFHFVVTSRPKRLQLDPENQLLKYQKSLGWMLYDREGMKQSLWIYGTLAFAERHRRDAENFAKRYQRAGGFKPKIMADTNFTPEHFHTRYLMLFGSPATNQVANRFKHLFPIPHDGVGFRCQDCLYDKPSHSIIQVAESPLHRHHYICLFSFGVGGPPRLVHRLIASYQIFDGERLITHGLAHEEIWFTDPSPARSKA